MPLPAHYFTADLHLGHSRILQLDGRPWDDIEVHDIALAQRMRPRPEDRNRSPQLWLLGDVGHKKKHVEALLRDIRPHWAKIHLIRGNHDDRAAWAVRELFDSANEALYLRISPVVRLYLSHYAHRVWRNSHHGSYHLHGHSHGALPRDGRSMDVGVMLHDYLPVPLRQVIALLDDAVFVDHHAAQP